MLKAFCLAHIFSWALWFLEASATVSWIVPGTVWTDSDGAVIDAHGANILKEGSTFYLVGSSYADNFQPRIYTSTDLMNWVNEGVPFPVINMFRPKIFKGTSNYYILGQVSNLAQQLVSTSILSGWSEGPSMSLPPDSWIFTDDGVFVDDDGSTYFITSAQSNNLQINAISGNGTIGARQSVIEDGPFEAPSIFKVDGVYYLISSAKTGYTPNPNKVFFSTSLTGPWSEPTDIAPEDTNTYNSQNSAELTIEGSEATTYIFLGDAWVDDGSASSTYMWLPMTVDTDTNNVTLQDLAMWTVDLDTGVVSVPSTGKRYEAEHAEISGRASITNCEHCISKRGVHKIDPSSHVTFKEVNGTGEAQWVSMHYTTEQPYAGSAYVIINDETTPRVISDYNRRAGFHHTIPIRLTLENGPINTIRFGCSGEEGFKIHLDGIELHES
jgi:hypothetical protein